MQPIKLINGSSSEFRKMLLEKAGYEFITEAPEIDEKAIRFDDPGKLVIEIAMAKSYAVIAKTADLGARIIITSDQVIERISDHKILEKPEDGAEAYQFLRSYEKSPVRSHTSLVVYHSPTGRHFKTHDVSELYLSPFSAEERKVMLEDPMTYQSAGALPYGMPESIAATIIEQHKLRLVGEESSFIGLPMSRLRSMLSAIGYTKSLAKSSS